MGLTPEELNRLVDDLDAAETALREHRQTGIAVWRGDNPPARKLVTIDAAWLDRYHELRATADRLDQELRDQLARM